MANPISRGQCVTELALILAALLTVWLTVVEIAGQGPRTVDAVQLSREVK